MLDMDKRGEKQAKCKKAEAEAEREVEEEWRKRLQKRAKWAQSNEVQPGGR